MALILEHIDVLPRVITLIQYYGQFTGLILNLSKTIEYSPQVKISLTLARVQISSELVKYLGSYLGNKEEAENMNFQMALNKMRVISSRWRARHLTLWAWVLVLKCMIFSIFTHVLNTVTISGHRLDLIQKFANDFLWQGRNRLAVCKCFNPAAWGGLNHLYVKCFVWS